MTMFMPCTGHLTINVEEPKEEKNASGKEREPSSNFFMQRNSKPGDQYTEECGNKDMPCPRQGGHADCFVASPALRPCSDHKRKPVGWNSGVEEGNTEAGQSN